MNKSVTCVAQYFKHVSKIKWKGEYKEENITRTTLVSIFFFKLLMLKY